VTAMAPGYIVRNATNQTATCPSSLEIGLRWTWNNDDGCGALVSAPILRRLCPSECEGHNPSTKILLVSIRYFLS
jgi:hypothetical protein